MVGRNVEISRREMLAALVVASIVFPSLSAAADPLPSWNVVKGAVVEFVTEVTTPGSAELVPARSGSPSLITTARFGSRNRSPNG
jgi:hypothetical protein